MTKLLEIAKDVILNHHNKKNKAINFDTLWTKTAANAKIKDVKDEDMIAEFYMELLQDPNFIKTNDNEWTLKQFHTFQEVEQMSANNFKTEEFEIGEENYQDYLSKDEIIELKHKGRNSETTSLDLESLDGEDDESTVMLDDDEDSDDLSDDDFDESDDE